MFPATSPSIMPFADNIYSHQPWGLENKLSAAAQMLAQSTPFCTALLAQSVRVYLTPYSDRNSGDVPLDGGWIFNLIPNSFSHLAHHLLLVHLSHLLCNNIKNHHELIMIHQQFQHKGQEQVRGLKHGCCLKVGVSHMEITVISSSTSLYNLLSDSIRYLNAKTQISI